MAAATETSPGLPAAAQAANINTLTDALADAHISDDKPSDEKNTEGDSLEDGEIRDDDDDDDEDEVDDGKPKTVFDSAKKFNLKVSDEPRPVTGNEGKKDQTDRNSTLCSPAGRCTLTLRRARCCPRRRAQHPPRRRSPTVSRQQ